MGFGLVIAPIASRAINAVSEDYRGTAASLVVVARMLGMTLGMAALSAWGVEHFQVLTAGLESPLLHPGESAEALQTRLEEYTAQVAAAGLSLFQNFFRIAGVAALRAGDQSFQGGRSARPGRRRREKRVDTSWSRTR